MAVAALLIAERLMSDVVRSVPAMAWYITSRGRPLDTGQSAALHPGTSNFLNDVTTTISHRHDEFSIVLMHWSARGHIHFIPYQF